ncbi:hypothetical protein DMN91_007755 [Ooceraea biroi]|uniref:Amidase domain-containing protein n=1 Tax=Ooceraea biroi TaxID=2015173 RepID=A0A3L8DH60_OOCBI|nr:fatty-acid amide hydrolase 2 [Ooceraea biroi]RLU19198.1 hypothetical protein DMN91_007755 [Ooceraea biroi]
MLLRLRITQSILNVISLILRPIWLFIFKKPPSIPPPTIPTKKYLLTLSATTLARKIRQRKITCYHLVDAYAERIKEVNPYLNAVVDNCFGDAIIQAKLYDEQLKAGKYNAETLEKEKPLYGVPFTVKESCSLKGCSYTAGSLARKKMKATRDSEVVEILRNAGAIPLCVTNTPEMCGGVESSNLLHGRTRNPYDTRYSPGGSSGGEGALLGAGASLIGVGSDFGGSIRIPAVCNGVFGLKPTPGIVPLAGHLPLNEDELFRKFLTLGPLTRYAEDLDLLIKLITVKCDRPLHLNVPVDLKQLKIYYQQGLDNKFCMHSVDPEIKECILKAANHFTQYSNCVKKLPIELPNDILEVTIVTYFNIKNLPNLLIDANNPGLRKNSITELAKSLFGLSQHTSQTCFFTVTFETHLGLSKEDISYYTKKGEEIREKLLNLLGQDGVLICPTFSSIGMLPEFSICEILNISYSSIFNTFGLPAVNVPMGLSRKGLPLGLQVVAAPYQDRLCLAVAKELEAAFGGWVPPYPVSN